MRALLTLLVNLICAGSALAGASTRHVVVVGVNDSLDAGVARLSYADDDAARYAEILGRGAATLSVLTVLDAESQPLHPEVASVARVPNQRELSRALAQTFAAIEKDLAAGKDADLVFVYVGHGATDDDGEGYVNLLDTRLTRTALFEQVINQSPARFNHIIVDACSAFHLLNRGTGSVMAARRLLERTSLKGHPNTGVLLSTSSDVETHEWSRIRGGVFSHEVLSALTGAADVDTDFQLRYQEVGAFIEAANAGVKDRRARIDFYIRPPRLFLNRPVLDARPGEGPRLALEKGDEGHFVVEDARGVVIAEVNKNGEQPLSVALTGEGPWRVTQDDDSWLTGDLIQGDAQREVRLAMLSPAPEGDALVARSAVSEALERGLFKQPFGKSYVDGYAARLVRDVDAEVAAEAALAPAGPGGLPWTLLASGSVGLLAMLPAAATGIALFVVVQAQTGLVQGQGSIDAFEAQNLQNQVLGGAVVAGAAALTSLALVGGAGGLAAWWALSPPDGARPDTE